MKLTRDDFDSDEEFMFYCWLLEAKTAGVIDSFMVKPPSVEIFSSVGYEWEKQLKTKTKIIKGELLKPWRYAADFQVIGNLKQFHTGTHKIVDSFPTPNAFIIDTKGTGARFKDNSKFPLIQKALYHSKGIYVNKIVPEYFFKNAWLPMPITTKDDFLWTNLQCLKSGKIKPQKKRGAFKDCKTYYEKYGHTPQKDGI